MKAMSRFCDRIWTLKGNPLLGFTNFSYPCKNSSKADSKELELNQTFLVLFADLDGFFYSVREGVDVAGLLIKLRGSFRSRKYSDHTVYMALDSILNRGMSVSRASIDFGIKRTSLQFYLKKLNINIRH